jgi:hypothetical protein
MNEPRVNVVEWTVFELSAKKSIEHSYGYVRVLGEIRFHCAPT